MEDIEVPSFFLCPISLEIMKDPVIVPTGITYDRASIEKWLFSGKNNTCPVTKQIISSDCEQLTPNHNLRRLIQSWCTLNASYGIERIPTPKPQANKTQIAKLINDAKAPLQQVKCLRKLRSIADENDTNKRCMESSGVVEFLVSIINKFNSVDLEESTSEDYGTYEVTRPSDEALSLLYNLKLSESSLKKLNGHQFIESLTQIMQRGNYESRAYAVLLLKLVIEVADPIRLTNLKPEFFEEIVQVLRDQISQKATKATLQVLIDVCPWGKNRIKAIEAGAVSFLIDLLLESKERRPCEMMLSVLELLCQCAEGRAELLRHGAGLAMVSKKILRVSHVASDRGVRILYLISRFSASPSVVQEMLQLGVVAKLCLVVQVDCGSKTKERAREILKLHARVWMSSNCMPLNLLSAFPA